MAMTARTVPRLEDVARRAGVSTATVSRCLNEPQRLRAETRERVEAAIEALGYVPHFGGQALASNRTNTIGAIIPTMENAIFARGLQAVEETLAAAGVTLLLASSAYDPAREAEQARALLRRGVDGLLLIGAARPQATYDLIARHRRPLVLAWTLGPAAGAACVGFDNRKAARDLAALVLEHGHRDVAMIAGVTAWNDRAAARIAGVRDAMEARGLALAPERLVEAPYAIEAAERAFSDLMAPAARRPTAVICGNDVLAAGAIKAARAMGLRVPQDVSITGFDNLDLAEVVPPGVTTAKVPHRRMGRQAAETLLALRDGKRPPQFDALAVAIEVRGSLSHPPAR
ncbi:MAG: LacI family DNA-binding transcriptional regulator [Pseudomonadota bacterium]